MDLLKKSIRASKSPIFDFSAFLQSSKAAWLMSIARALKNRKIGSFTRTKQLSQQTLYPAKT
jgi:hypothetical protein